jgi:hypothetical protein
MGEIEISDPVWVDFEVCSALDLKAAGTIRYATGASTRAIVLAYAIGDGPVRVWHADGAILNWDTAPEDLRDAFDRGATFAAWNASFDSAVWNYATVGFPFLEAERVIDPMIQAGVSNLPTDLESASRYLGGEGKQKDGRKLIKLFCVEGADPREHPEKWERFLAYARRDTEEMRDAYRKTRPLPHKEWQEYWAFEQINRRGVTLDMPFVWRAEALAAEDGIASGRRLAELTDGAVTRVTQAKRIATWLFDQLPDAAMREILTVGVPADEEDDVCNGDDEDEQDTGPEFSLRRERVERLIAMLDVKQTNGGLSVNETKAHEAATIRLFGAGAAPKKFARLAAQQVDGVLRDQYRFSGGFQTGRMCVDAETLIDTPTGSRRIIDLRPGDLVITHRQRPRPVLALVYKGREPMVCLNGPNGEHVTATLSHRLLTQRGWSKISALYTKSPTGSFTLRKGCEPLSFIAQDNVCGQPRPWSESSDGIQNLEARAVAGGLSARQSATENKCPSTGSLALRDDCEPLPFDVRIDRYNRAQPRYGASHGLYDPETGAFSGGVLPAHDGLSFSQQSGRVQPAVWGAQSVREDHAPRLLREMEWRRLHFGTPHDSGKNARLGNAARNGGGSSYRRRHDEQSPRQHSNCHWRGTSAPAPTPTWPLVCVGERDVWDISVAGDGSYLAQGLAHHNSSKSAQIQNLTRDVLGGDGAAEAPLVDAVADGCSYAELAAAEPVDVPVSRKLALLVRPAIIAAPKKILVWSDWSAIEARITPWLAASEGGEAVLDIYRANDRDPSLPDIYTIAAANILHKDPREVTKLERQTGKVATLALQFLGSVGALKAMALSYRIHLDDAEARRIVDAWRQANAWAMEFGGAHNESASYGLWGAALSAWEMPGTITTAGRLAFIYREDYLGGALFMGLPSGRLLTYPRPRWHDVDILDKDSKPTGEKRTELSFRRARSRVKLRKGRFVENATQAVAADILRETATRIETNPALASMRIRMTCHDEIVSECDEDRAEEAKAILRYEMLTLPDWAEGLPLQSEEAVAYYYSKAKTALRGGKL